MFDRRSIIVGGATLVAGCATPVRPGTAGTAPSRFVGVDGLHFVRDGKPYRYAGANVWYGAWLGADTAYGNRARLGRELDRLQALGVRNLRIIGSAEESPLKNSITPGFRGKGSSYNEDLLKGLDWTLAEMAKRDMTAIVYLANFWEWSGGMMTYLSWVNGGNFINMNDPAHPWPEFPDRNAAFYTSRPAQTLLRDYIKAVVQRTNSVTGVAYADDPTIMAWQLANEPRPGGSDAVAVPNLPNFYRWIDETARYIKALDGHHLVTTGSEGLKGSIEREDVVLDAHRSPAIDYMTTHIWPNNWSWMDAGNLATTYDAGSAKVADYIAAHVRLARQLGKPLVIEEFGYPRDGATAYDPKIATTFKDRFYRQIYAAVEADTAAGGPLAGSNFWAWNGEARTPHADYRFVRGDLGYMGDPPHEPQGWYGVFDSDASTMAVIKAHAAALAG
ncbi:cellulase family glycosylhydrolase [Sphingomonadaceae bacterium OTU29THOMA1]|uniref:glycoside hydrolase 5 family protein n=1 Tax=Sphingomonas sp. Leaf37 TaxID=2876552 RepID=UPI001E4F5326|nr:cellulase family glycosylhydrolase [Sphingomonas sp. Leaf37]USU12170.1 cellulase family glycosylhydrolase [Sphingomonadaceae bacterium OTU29THOMA1]